MAPLRTQLLLRTYSSVFDGCLCLTGLQAMIPVVGCLFLVGSACSLLWILLVNMPVGIGRDAVSCVSNLNGSGISVSGSSSVGLVVCRVRVRWMVAGVVPIVRVVVLVSSRGPSRPTGLLRWIGCGLVSYAAEGVW